MKYNTPLFCILLSLLLAGCNALPQIQHLNPQQINLGQPATLTLQLDNASAEAQVAIRPSHITTKHRQLLSSQASALLILANDQQLITEGGVLKLQNQQQLISQLILPETIRHLALSGETVLLADSAQQLYRIATDQNQLRILQQWSLPHSIDHLGAHFVASFKGELSLVANTGIQHYTLDQPFNAIDCLADHCYLASADGVVIIELQPAGKYHNIGLFSVAGAVNDLQIVDEQLYLAGDMGFTVVDIQNPQQPRWLASNNKFGPADELAVGEFFALLRNQQGGYHLVDIRMPNQPIWSGYFSGPKDTPFALHQNSAWLVDELELLQLDIANATLPILNHSGINLGGSRRVQLRDNTLYVADWFSGLHLYDISNPEAPQHQGNLHTPGSAKGVWLDDHYLYLGDDDHGLQIIDLNTLSVVHQVATTGLAYTMDRQGDLLYLADHRGGFHLIDISEPEKAHIVGSHDTPQKVWSIQAYKNFALVTDDQSGVLIFDLSNPSQPRQVAQYQPGGFAEDIVVRGDIAYVAFFNDGLHILDISNPQQPQPLGYLATPGNARGIYLEDNLLYLADWYAGLQIIDIENPQQPQWLGGVDTPGAAWGVVVHDQQAYIMDWWGGIQTADISDPHHPKLQHNTHQQDRLADIALNHNHAYLAAGHGGLQVFDINNSQGPIWSTALALSGSSNQIVVNNNLAYISHHPGGISVVDIQDPFYAQLIEHHPVEKPIQQLSLLGDRLLALSADDSLTSWKIGADKRLHLNTSHSPDGLRAVGDSDHWAVVINQQGGIELLDPQTLDSLSVLPGDFKQVILANNTLYALTDKQLFIALLHDTHIQPVSRFAVNQTMYDMQLSDSMLYLSGEREVLAVAVDQPEQPALRHIYPRSGQAGAIAIEKGALFAAGDKLLASTPLLPPFKQQHQQEQWQLALSAGYPLGKYDLIMRRASGEQQEYNNAFQVQMPRGRRVNFTMEDLQKAISKVPSAPE
ncbi:hypothetical protein MNBD_GAMMA18-753 [hydrothermal vent metagenome]|uniref:Uncharacterized protein n=1 Tax=hydrothermal vent metagenome TaxID=652676 RepID=A0A3B0Z3P6_9ZZZZ